MNEQLFYLVDPAGTRLAEVRVQPSKAGWLLGKITANHLPEEMRRVFRYHEEVANEGMLSFLEEAETAIARLGLGVIAANEASVRPVFDLQIMNGDDVAFHLVRERPPAHPAVTNGALVTPSASAAQPEGRRD